MFERRFHARRAVRLYAVNPNCGADGFERERDACDQSAAADRHDNDVDVGNLFGDLQPDRALSRDNVLVVERVDKSVTVFVAQLQRAGVSVIVNAFHKAELRAVSARRFHFGNGRARRQTDKRFDAVFRRGKRYALRMVACGTGDNAFSFFFLA